MAVVMLLVLSLGAGNVFATARHEKTEDANLDYIVNITDATAIQKYS